MLEKAVKFMIVQAVALLAGSSLSAQVSAVAGGVFTIDSCRQLAVENNKQLRIQAEKVRMAGYQKKEAFAAYLPGLDFAGGYTYNQKDISVFGSDQLLPIKSFDGKGYAFDLVTGADGKPVMVGGKPVPKQMAYLPKEALSYDIHNVFFGAITLTQPIYMGGKIVAMNKITGYAKELAEAMHDDAAEDVIYSVDAAYWQVVSLRAKQELAVHYVALLDTLRRNVNAMVEQGVATRSDLLSVDVKLNQANVDLVKVNNGLDLSRMALAQICGLPVDTPMKLADENPQIDQLEPDESDLPVASTFNMADIYARRPDLRALETGVKITHQQSKVAMSSMLPNLALVGAYSFSNPNMFNGFRKEFAGAFSVGAMLRIPLWHWGGNYNKYRAAKSEETIMRLQVEDAKQMIELQVNQASFKTREAVKTHIMTQSNLTKANENLRQATLAFREGLMTPDNVMEAQTAWLKANSENIDAAIDERLTRVYLSKVLGTMTY
ncbi:MAG: TolC family protein [Muribaculum sp.]|nr:TolC family protein [Muribaculaceae bacterium]MCM1081795.1 TolC family protein [Muribaculum sp.]